MKKILFTILLCFFCVHSFCQSNFKFYNEISIPTTDAWSFINQSEITPSLYTGSINLSIPIYTYQDNDFTIPVSAQYSSNGNIPNLKSGILGPGWSLPVGGCITLEIRGIPDYGKNFFNVPGFLMLHKDSIFYNSHQIDKLWRFVYLYDEVEMGATCPQIVYCPNGIPNQTHSGEYDAEPDIFHFNFMGHSGSFHLDFSNRIQIYNISGSPHDYKIELFTHPYTLDHLDYTRIDSISITYKDGYKYIFNGTGANVDLNKDNNTGRYDIISSWHLTKIVAPNGRQIVFEYSSFNQEKYSPGSSYYMGNISDNQYRFWEAENISYFPTKEQDPNEIIKTESKNAFLNAIIINNEASINFNYLQIPAEYGDQYKDSKQSQLKTYSSTYRLSGIDVIYNVDNEGHAQTVKRALFSYKTNSNGARTSYLSTINISGEGEYEFDYHQWNNSSIPYPYNGSLFVDHYGYYNGQTNNYYPTTSLDNSKQEEWIASTDREPNYLFALCGVISKITYPTGGYTTLEYEPNDYSLAIERPFNFVDSLSHRPKLIRKSGVTSGVRIAAIRSYLSDNKLFSEKLYTYSDSLGSTGILCYVPRYSINYDSYAGAFVREGATYKSSSLLNYNTTHIEYKSVKEILPDSSSIMYLFTTNATEKSYQDKVFYGPTAAEPFKTTNSNIIYWEVSGGGYSVPRVHYAVAPLTSKQNLRGQLNSIIKYSNNSQNIPISYQKNIYSIFESYSEVPSYLVRRFGTHLIFTGRSYLSEAEKKIYSDEISTYSSSKEKYTYNDFGEISSIQITSKENDTILYTYKYLRDLTPQQIEADSVYGAMKERFILNLPLEEKIYNIKQGDTTLIDGTICEYAIFENLIKPHKILHYYQENGWVTDLIIENYDQYGNITQLIKRDHRTFSYIWGWGGQKLLCQAEGITYTDLMNRVVFSYYGNISDSIKEELKNNYRNAIFTFIDHNIGVGVSSLETADGNKESYYYTTWGKLQKRINNVFTKQIDKIEYSIE